MKYRIRRRHVGVTCLFFVSCALGLFMETSGAQAPPARVGLGSLPVFFEPAEHQAAEPAQFVGRARGYTASLGADRLVLTLKSATVEEAETIELYLAGAEPNARARTRGRLPGHSNYFSGSDPALWRTRVPHYAAVEYERIYPGVDIVYYDKQGWIEYDFHVAPHADPQAIRLRYERAAGIDIDERGDLVLESGGRELRQKRPIVYQEVEGRRQEITASYALLENGDVGFELGAYDRGRALVIDPVLEYSSYLGTNLLDNCGSIAVDSGGNTYVVANQGSQVAVVKMDPSGSGLLYRTELGGSGLEETGCQGSNIALDAAGNAYVTGQTSSMNFPTTAGAFNGQLNGTVDLFVVKLDTDGAMVYGTYMGGGLAEEDPSVALSQDGAVYIAAETRSNDFPTTQGAYDTTYGGQSDIVVAKLQIAGKGAADLLYSSYVGGSSNDEEPSLVVDAQDAVYVVAETGPPGTFPTTPGAFDTSHNGEIDTVVFKIDPAGRGDQDLIYSTYFGGSGTDIRVSAGKGIAIDALGDVYIIGATDSQNVPLPLTPGAFDRTFNGEVDTFIAKMRPNGEGRDDLIFATLFGGSGLDLGAGIFVDEARLIYFVADSDSENVPVPTVNPIQATSAGGVADILMGVMSPDGSELLFSSYLGGGGEDCCPDLFVDSSGRLHLVGETNSFSFPTTPDASDRNLLGGTYDSFVARVGEMGVRLFTLSNASGRRPELAPGSIASGYGLGLSDQVLSLSPDPSSDPAKGAIDLPTSLGNVSVRVTDSTGQVRLAELFFVSPIQINYLVPAGTALGWAWVEVVKDGDVVSRDGILITTVAPGIYTANGSGSGAPLAFTLRFPASGPSSQESVADVNGNPVPIDLGPPTDQVYLILYGTGMRGGSTVTATVGGMQVAVAGPVALDQFVGLDQANLGPLPRTLIGSGQVEVEFVVDGTPANTVVVNFQ